MIVSLTSRAQKCDVSHIFARLTGSDFSIKSGQKAYFRICSIIFPVNVQVAEPSISLETKKQFYAEHVFHERHMNSCPIGCDGCAVSASTTNKGSIKFNELIGIYREAKDLGVKMRITKVEGYDPVFVSYSDKLDASFADTVRAAIDLGHEIITPICTTGNWKSERSRWQIEELGKLEPKYRRYYYPSGNSGEAIVLSVPREIRPFANGKYNYDLHIEKLLVDLDLLSRGGRVEALIYYNSDVEGDLEFAERIKAELHLKLSETISAQQLSNIDLVISNFNGNTLPESCYRYPNSVLFSDKGFEEINPITLQWNS